VREKDLVMLRLPNDLEANGRKEHFNTWFRIMFIDNDGTFIGRVEKINRWEFTLYQIGEDVKLNSDSVLRVYQDGDQFCYDDNISICECAGLCRNK
jgi:hypothetical protein